MAKRGSRGKAVRARSKADREFISEAEEILERMRGDLIDVHELGGAVVETAPDLLNRLFRSAHSLKALAGMVGFDPIGRLSHQLEGILDGLRLSRVSTGQETIDLIDDAVRLFTELLTNLGDDDALAGMTGAIEGLASRIEATVGAGNATGDEIASIEVDPSLLRALTEYEEHRLRENIRRGRHILLIEATFEIISFENELSELSDAIRSVAELLSTLPAPGDTPESQIRFSLLAASDLSATEAAARLQFPRARVRAASHGGASRAASPAQSSAGAADAPAPTRPVDVSPDIGSESLKSIGDTVRVEIPKLDELMNLVAELLIDRGAVADIVARLRSEPNTEQVARDLAKVHKGLDRKLKSLQTAVLDVRMVPLRQVFERVSRVVRGLRRRLQKDVRLEIHGADTELDKLIVEEIVDPLMHVVRNALDHAIESPEEREASGKSAQGTIRIDAFQRGNHVVIEVADDGRGIDVDALRVRAEARGILEPGQALTEQESLDLIFAPGISTRAEVSETSGRGVGMDVVRANLMSLGGVVDVVSKPGQGSAISMILPITLAIIQSLVVSVGKHRFAIPLGSVVETLRVEPGDIQRSESTEMLNLRGEPVLLRRLDAEFGLEPVDPDAAKFVVVLGMGDPPVGLVVDDLQGQRDTVIKPILGPVQRVRGIAGATEFGDQDPVLVLDVSAFVNDTVVGKDAA